MVNLINSVATLRIILDLSIFKEQNSYMKLFITILVCSFFFKVAAAQRTDSLLKVINAGNRDVDEVKALNALAFEYMRTDLPKAKSTLHTSISLCKSIKNEEQLSSAYVPMVTIFHNMAMTDSAEHYLQLLEALAAKSKKGAGTNATQANFYAAAGLYYKKTGNLKRAIEYLKKAANMNPEGISRSSIAGQLMNIGNTYTLLGDYRNALTHHLKAMKIFEEEGNVKGQSFVYQNISNAFIMLQQFPKALTYTNKSIALKRQLNDVRGIGTAEISLGQIYIGLKKPALAIQHLEKAMEITSGLNLVAEQAKINFNLAKAHLEKKDTSRAIQFFNESKLVALKIPDSSLSASVDMELIALNTKKEGPATVEKMMITGLQKLDEAGQLPRQVTGYQNIAAYYEANQQYDKALEYTKKYHAYTDSINGNDLQMQVKKIEEQYSLDKKEQEITILKKDQQLQKVVIEKQKLYQAGSIVLLALMVSIAVLIINRNRTIHRSRQMLAMEKMRNGIARDLHDDIGSTLTSINILSKVMLQQAGEKETPQTSNLQKIKAHSASIMESMSDIVWAINPHNDTVEKVIYKMKEFAAEVLDPLNIAFRFSVEGDFAQVKLTVEKRKDLYLVFKEAINNAAKYSNCDTVNILLKHADGNIQLQVTDNGNGFDAQTVKYGNGVHNIRERAKNMQASLVYDSSPGTGTVVQLTIPLT
jgi:two-component system, NarL family, sensor histidine kinase UhpB